MRQSGPIQEIQGQCRKKMAYTKRNILVGRRSDTTSFIRALKVE